MNLSQAAYLRRRIESTMSLIGRLHRQSDIDEAYIVLDSYAKRLADITGWWEDRYTLRLCQRCEYPLKPENESGLCSTCRHKQRHAERKNA